MHLPDDYGMSAVQTLAHVGSSRPPARHSAFWGAWDQLVTGCNTRLHEVTSADADPSDPTATHRFESVRAVRIGCSLLVPRPTEPLRAAIISLHGYGDPPPLGQALDRWRHASEHGVAVMCLRVRGFPGSRLDTGDLESLPLGWVSAGLDHAAAAGDDSVISTLLRWSLPEAVADVALAMRVLREHLSGFGASTPLYLEGESFGAGLAVIAAARCSADAAPNRIVLGHPTFGDWAWRLAHPADRPDTVGFHARHLLMQYSRSEARLVEALELLDAVVHAPNVVCPVLCKLAERDDAVPAPTAAAVFNALGTAPGLKWRFITPFGHFDGGLRNARRHALFEKAAEAFLDPRLTPDEAMRPFERAMTGHEKHA